MKKGGVFMSYNKVLTQKWLGTILYMNNYNKIINDIDAIPSLVQSKRQIDRYNLDIDAQLHLY